MKGYWLRIGLGALGVFVIGMMISSIFHSGKHAFQGLVDSTNVFTIPFPFGVMPFNVDGKKYGTIEKITFYREHPNTIKSVRVVADLPDSAAAGKLSDCEFVMNDPENIDVKTAFQCARNGAPDGYEEFGEVVAVGLEGSFPLYLPTAAVTKFREHGSVGRVNVTVGESTGAAIKPPKTPAVPPKP